ncbi:hypothetical protein Vretimale_14042 [Volvox reticuliferus]|uniref:Uncharacterized protein n=1 Tax=Volvox reticuliferus TaxID=1737510 RepID=A0A8J4FTC6_9CHLO|nr:hypothetical protein Vretifemale_16166 [Volvox reticuliferus]GIM10245.1 hypothetical protein Vretimale_14042 [Volvox reticuliferus]
MSEVVSSRQRTGAGSSRTSSGKSDEATGRRRQPARRLVARRQLERQDVIDLTNDDDDVQITRVNVVKRPRLQIDDDVVMTATTSRPRVGGTGMPLLVPGALPLFGALTAGLGQLNMIAPLAATLPLATATGAAAAAAPVVAAVPPQDPPSPKGYKCVICMERMDGDLATTVCGHMFCYKCISAWVKKSGTCPQCRGKLSKAKIIRIYPPS